MKRVIDIIHRTVYKKLIRARIKRDRIWLNKLIKYDPFDVKVSTSEDEITIKVYHNDILTLIIRDHSAGLTHEVIDENELLILSLKI